MYTDLIFDLYGTLVDIHTEENDTVWEKTALYFGYYGAMYSGSELRSAFEAELKKRQAKAGQSYECFPDIPFHEVMADLFRRKGVTEQTNALGIQAAQLFRICSTEYIRLYSGVLKALASLRQKGYRLWLLSNAQEMFTKYELNHLGLTDVFDGIYLSSCFGCRKPDGRFFRALLETEGLDPKNCLMIGNDRDTDIAGAKAAGIDTFYLHTQLTPAEQSPADPQDPMEFEGEDWGSIVQILSKLQSIAPCHSERSTKCGVEESTH